jgi:hypothetical protein
MFAQRYLHLSGAWKNLSDQCGQDDRGNRGPALRPESWTIREKTAHRWCAPFMIAI